RGPRRAPRAGRPTASAAGRPAAPREALRWSLLTLHDKAGGRHGTLPPAVHGPHAPGVLLAGLQLHLRRPLRLLLAGLDGGFLLGAGRAFQLEDVLRLIVLLVGHVADDQRDLAGRHKVPFRRPLGNRVSDEGGDGTIPVIVVEFGQAVADRVGVGGFRLDVCLPDLADLLQSVAAAERQDLSGARRLLDVVPLLAADLFLAVSD